VQSYADDKAVGIALLTFSRQRAVGIPLLPFSKLMLLVPIYDLVMFAFDFFVVP
jgi:hypothetical protein